jgi:hypothetical protein
MPFAQGIFVPATCRNENAQGRRQKQKKLMKLPLSIMKYRLFNRILTVDK